MHGTVIPRLDVYPSLGTSIYPANQERSVAGPGPARTLGEASHVGTSDSATRPRNRVPHARAHSWTHHPPREPLRPRELIKPFVFLDLFDFDGEAWPVPM